MTLVYFLQKIPPAKWLGLNVICWGIAAAAAAGAKDYTTLLVARIFLGIFEATVGPSLMLISSQYYTKSEQAPRFTFWFLGLGVAQIFGGIISFAFQHVHSKFASWRIMFLVMGLITVVVGFSTLFYLPDTPMQAKWLSDDEKVALLQHTRVNQTGIRNSKFNSRQILEAVLDVQVWLFCLMVALVRAPSSCSERHFVRDTIMIQNLTSVPTVTASRVQWGGHRIFIDSHRRVWLRWPHLCPSQCTIWHCKHFLHTACRYWYSQGLKSMGMGVHLQYPWNYWWRAHVLPSQGQSSRYSSWYILG